MSSEKGMIAPGILKGLIPPLGTFPGVWDNLSAPTFRLLDGDES